MVTAVHTAPSWSSSAPPVEMVSGLVRQDNFVPSRRFREGGLENSKLLIAVNGGGGVRVNTLGGPAVAKQTKLVNSDSLQVQVELVVSTPQIKQNNSDFGGHVARLML